MRRKLLLAGALLTASLVFIAMGLWYVFFKKRWQIRRAKRDHVTAVAALQAARVETAWLEAAQAVLSATEAWLERQAEKLRATRGLLEKVQALLAVRPLPLPSNPIIVETLPYLDGYAIWLQTLLQDDPLMLEVQAALERDQALADWPDLDETALLKAFIEAGRQALRAVPEFSVEDVLTSQNEETLSFHLDRLHRLATPLIDLNRPMIVSQSGEPGTLDIACWEQGAVTRLRGWLENHLPDSASIAITGDPQRVTYIRLIPGFDLGSLGDNSELVLG
jgi:hypothetical protein